MALKIIKLDNTFENIFLKVFSQKQVLHFQDLGYYFIQKYPNRDSYIHHLSENDVRGDTYYGELTKTSEYLDYFKSNNISIIKYNFDILSQLGDLPYGYKLALYDIQGFRLGSVKILKDSKSQKKCPWLLLSSYVKEAGRNLPAVYESPNKLEPFAPPITTDIGL